MVDLSEFLPKKGKNKNYYWALIIEPGWVQAGIWTVEDEKAEIIAKSAAIAWETDDELINASDAVLSACVQNLPEDAGEPNKTVFGVPGSWVSEGAIKEEFLGKIKHICTNLSLEPVGFVELPEAISHFIKFEEGTPLNAVIIGVAKESIEVSVFKIGNVVGSATVARSVDMAEDLVEGLSRFSLTDHLPTRFILYDGKEGELEDIKESLLSVNWEGYEKIKFLHTPKIEVMPVEKKVLAVALAGGAEIANAKSIVSMKEEPSEGGESFTVSEEEPNVEAASEDTVASLGFVVGKDIEAEKLTSVAAEESPEQPIQPAPQTETTAPAPPHYHEVMKKPVEQKTNPITKLTTVFGSLMAKFKKVEGEIKPNISVQKSKRPYLIAGFILSLLVGLLLLWWFLPKAQVTLYISPKTLEDTVAIQIDPEATSVDRENNTIPGKRISEEASGEKTKSTTGTKTVGDKAKGEITLFRSGAELELKSGTVLTGPEGLKFTLDGDVTIASGSASTPGTAKSAVTAADIGTQYNLNSGSVFEVGSYPKSDIEAKNESAFSGGSSREVQAVSEADQKALEDDLVDELEEKAKLAMNSQISETDFLVEESVESSIKDRKFSNKVGDEASSLKLSLTAEASALVVDKSTIIDYARESLKGDIPDGYVLRDEQIDVDFEIEDEEDGVYKVSAIVKANLLPQVDTAKIASEISGKYPSVATNYLKSIQGFVRAEIKRKPTLPGRLGTLPMVDKNISITVAASD
jgi:hypothetical protein